MLLSSLMDATNSEKVLFGVFALIIALFLLIDLGVLNKTNKKTTTKSALYQSVFWVFISTLFGVFVYYNEPSGMDAAFEYFSAYLTEYALSVDNIFVILLILKYFSVKEEYYHKILFWGILGAVVFRGIFIFVGALLIQEFEAILYVFGVLLIYSGIKIYFEDSDDKIDPEKNPVMRLCKKYLPMTTGDHGGQFMITKPKIMFTPLFLVVVLIETTDLIFAIDSIPAAFAITTNPFLIYTSNIFAVLGLRAMFFLLAGIIDKFYLLQKGLSIILFFIGAKMLLGMFDFHIDVELSFTVIVVTLALSIIFSVLIPKKEPEKHDEMPSKTGNKITSD